MERRLYRSRRDRIIAGVCGGIAEQMRVDPTLIRVAVILLTLLTQGGLAVAYVIMAFAVPEEPIEEDIMTQDEAEGFSRDSVPRAPDVPVAPEMPAAAPGAPSAPAFASHVAPTPSAAGPRRNAGSVGFGVLLVLIGVVLLANQFVPEIDVWRYWPVAVIVLGVVSVMRGLRG